MKILKSNRQLMTDLENAVAFRLFSDKTLPTLTVAEQIASQVGDEIIKGILESGSSLQELALADRFQVSRGPVRDAIRILEREGLATIYARRGAFVTELNTQEVAEIFEIRAGLFQIVARKIAAQRSAEFLATLRAGVEKLEELAQPEHDETHQYAETSYRLSILSVRNCGNHRLTHMLTALSLQTLRYAYISLGPKSRRKASLGLWKSGLLAIERGDADRFVEITRRRIEESGNAVIDILSRAATEDKTIHKRKT